MLFNQLVRKKTCVSKLHDQGALPYLQNISAFSPALIQSKATSCLEGCYKPQGAPTVSPAPSNPIHSLLHQGHPSSLTSDPLLLEILEQFCVSKSASSSGAVCSGSSGLIWRLSELSSHLLSLSLLPSWTQAALSQTFCHLFTRLVRH